GFGSKENFFDNSASFVRVLLHVLLQRLVDHRLNGTSCLRTSQTCLGLSLELWLWQLHGDNSYKTLARVVAGYVFVFLLQITLTARIVVERTRNRRTKTRKVHTAVGC